MSALRVRLSIGGWLVLSIATWLSMCAALAQAPTGAISGIVTDPSGAAVASAEVRVTNLTTGLTQNTAADAQGAFLFPLMPVGAYSVTVEMKGFRRFEQQPVTLEVDGVANVPVKLEIGSLSDTVTIHSDVAMVETSTATLKQVIGQQQLVELPLNGRNAASLVSLVPAAADLTAGNARGSDDAIQSSTFPGADPTAVSGGRGDGVNYLLDGGGYRDPYTNVNNPFPNPDALMEFNVQTNNYSAEYGRASGAIVSVVTKSGSNDIHGNLWEFLRNDVINARNFFSPANDILKRNQFGAGIGGPIIKDKLFYYTNFQATLLHAIPASASTVVPTPAELQGIFPTTVKNPTTGTPFPNNQIPLSLFNPISVKLFPWLPVSTSASGLVRYAAPDFEHEEDGMARLDYDATRNRISARYSVFDWHLAASTPAGNLPAATYGKKDSFENITLSDTYTLSPHVVNSALFTFARTDSATVSAAPFSWCSLGVAISCTGNPPSTELSLSVSGYFRFNTNKPGFFTRPSWNFSDSIHWVRGRHEIAIGFDYLEATGNIYNLYRMNGGFTFNGSLSGNALGDFMLGDLSAFTQGGGEFAHRQGKLAGGFFQDNWRASNRLTLNLGIRYDPYLPFTDVAVGETECFRPGQESTRFPNAPLGMIFQGDRGCPGPSDLGLFAPRLGFSYALTGDGRTVLRGGYGIFYQPPFSEMFNGMVDSAPFSPQIALTDVNFSSPYSGPNGTTNPFPANYGPFNPPSSAQFQTPVTDVSLSNSWRPAQIQSWNLTLERQLKSNLLVRVSYAASKGSYESYNLQLNPAQYAPGVTTATTNQRRPLYSLGFASMVQDQSAGNSEFNSLQLTLEKRFSQNFSFLASYTRSKSLDDNSGGEDVGDGASIIDPYNVRAYRAVSDYDLPNRLVASFVWKLPALAKTSALVRNAVGGWQASGIWTWESGFPFDVTSGQDRSLTGNGLDLAALAGNPYLSPDRARSAVIGEYFNTTAFSLATPGTFGTEGRNIIFGPGTFNIDFGLMKNFEYRERFHLQFRAEAFNLTNTPLFNNPDTGSPSDPTFGQITAARAARILQGALKLTF